MENYIKYIGVYVFAFVVVAVLLNRYNGDETTIEEEKIVGYKRNLVLLLAPLSIFTILATKFLMLLEGAWRRFTNFTDGKRLK